MKLRIVHFIFMFATKSTKLDDLKKLVDNLSACVHCLKIQIRFSFGDETSGVQSLAFLALITHRF